MPGTTSNGTPAADERLGLLAAAAEHERVAALEADDEPAREAVLDEAGIDLVLGHRVVVGALAGVDQLASARRLVEQLAADQAVEHEHLGAPHAARARAP